MESVVGVDDGGDPVVGSDLEEGGRELIALGDVDGVDAVREPDLLQLIDTFCPFGVIQV